MPNLIPGIGRPSRLQLGFHGEAERHPGGQASQRHNGGSSLACLDEVRKKIDTEIVFSHIHYYGSKSCLLELHEHDDISHDDGTEAQKFPSGEVDVAQKVEGGRVGHPPGEDLQFGQ